MPPKMVIPPLPWAAYARLDNPFHKETLLNIQSDPPWSNPRLFPLVLSLVTWNISDYFTFANLTVLSHTLWAKFKGLGLFTRKKKNKKNLI